MTRSFPTIEEVVAIHDDLLIQFGGSPGVRDWSALESAVMRPQMGYYDDLLDEAAAMLESLAMNHPFVDGNKRTAVGATDAFLGLNGHFIDCESRAAYDHFMRLFETNAFRFAELRAWLEDHVKPLPAS
ncbi:MAG: type II toxin-antitoxin system death-on-curing family toxin [Spirochaetaceae bacterium]|nr:type II toxin-antitoxin system death-on-curing family toxin [Spirochaetaceae bacterium]